MQLESNQGQFLGRGDGRKRKLYVRPEVKTLREAHTPRIHMLSLLSLQRYKGTRLCQAALHLTRWADRVNALIAEIEVPGEGRDTWELEDYGLSGLPLPVLNLRRADAENGARTVLGYLAQCCPANAFDALLTTFETIGVDWQPDRKKEAGV